MYTLVRFWRPPTTVSCCVTADSSVGMHGVCHVPAASGRVRRVPVQSSYALQIYRVGGTGIEPVTSSVSRCRSSRSGSAFGPRDLVVSMGGPSCFPCAYPRFPAYPRADVGPALGPVRPRV
jgi:hypothetical protein